VGVGVRVCAIICFVMVIRLSQSEKGFVMIGLIRQTDRLHSHMSASTKAFKNHYFICVGLRFVL